MCRAPASWTLSPSAGRGYGSVRRTGGGARLPAWVDHRHFHELDSTQSFAELEHSAFDQDRLTVISADLQTKGRGTKDRCWHAVPGLSVLMSFFFRFPSQCPTVFVNRNVANVTKVLSLAAVDALRWATSGGTQQLKFGVKWPNDIVVNGMKIGGVMARALPSPHGRLDGVIAGIGANINTPQEQLSQIDRPVWPATSLRALTGNVYDVPAIREHLIRSFAEELPAFFNLGFSAFRDRLNALEVLMGHPVRFRVHESDEVHGTFVGVDKAGHIVLRLLPCGQQRSYPAGEIIPLEPL